MRGVAPYRRNIQVHWSHSAALLSPDLHSRPNPVFHNLQSIQKNKETTSFFFRLHSRAHSVVRGFQREVDKFRYVSQQGA